MSKTLTRSPPRCVRVKKVLEGLPTSVAFAAYEFIIGPVLENSQRMGKQLIAPLDDRHSARRGPYRVIYRIDDQQMTVTVLAVSARSGAYRTP